MNHTPLLFVSCGDPLSINFEILAKAIKQHKEQIIVIVGSFYLWSEQCQKLRITTYLDAQKITENSIPETAGVYFLDLFSADKISSPLTKEQCGEIAMQSLEKASELSQLHQASLVTLPVNKYHCSLVWPGFKGQTDWLAERFDKNTIMILKNPELTVALCTNHIPISKVSESITKNAIQTKATLLHQFLKSTGIKNPKIGVCGLNPHCGDQGVIGSEDNHIQSWIQEINLETNMNLMGPIAADTLFQRSFREMYDGVLAMYHDQGLIPVKALSENKRCVNITWGLDFLRISPDHGPATDLYLKGFGNSGSLKYAFEIASQSSIPKQYFAGAPKTDTAQSTFVTRSL